jgi:hypothetical protein
MNKRDRYEQVTIAFTRAIKLPRFCFEPGETWNLARIAADGSIELGSGLVRADEYKETGSQWLLTFEAKARRRDRGRGSQVHSDHDTRCGAATLHAQPTMLDGSK